MPATLEIRIASKKSEGYKRVAEALKQRKLGFDRKRARTCLQPQIVIYHDKSEIIQFYTGTENILAHLDDIERIVKNDPN